MALQRGFAIALDVLFALILVAGIMTFFSTQPLTSTPNDESVLRSNLTTRDVLETLDKKGFLSEQLADQEFSATAADNIWREALNLLPAGTKLGLMITQYRLTDSMAQCISNYNWSSGQPITALEKFENCFPEDTEEPRPTFSSGSALPADSTTGYLRGKKIFARFQPTSDISDPDPSACVAKSEFTQSVDTNALIRAMLAPGIGGPDAQNLEFETSIVDSDNNPITALSCGQSATLDLNVRNDARNPFAVMLVMDRSGSMSQLDMNYLSQTGSFSGGLCAAQVQDLSGNANHANNYFVEPYVIPNPPVPGPSGIAGRFGRDRNRLLQIPDDVNATGTNVDTFTLSAWIYPTNLSVCTYPYCTIMVKEGEYWLAILSTGPSTGRVYMSITSASPGSGLRDTGVNVSLNTWTHVGIIYNGIVTQSYRNGVFIQGSPASGTIFDTLNPMRIGALNQTISMFEGYIDKVKVHDIALSNAQMTSLYNNNEPLPNRLRLAFDFESLAGDQNVACFKLPAEAPASTTNCAGLGKSGVGYPGGIPPDYVDFDTSTQFSLSAEKITPQWMPTSSSGLYVVLDRGAPSGICSQIAGSNNDKPPFIRVKSQSGSYFTYQNAVTATAARTGLNAGTYTVEIWNPDSNTYYYNTLNLYQYIFADWNQINTDTNPIAVAAAPYLREASDVTQIATNVAVPSVIFEEGQCTSSAGWTPVASFDLTDSNVYRLEFRVPYVNGGGQCGPHVRVVAPGGAETTLQCPNGSATCTILPWNTVRTSGSYAQTGTYQVYVKSDSAMTVNVSSYFERFFFGANNDPNAMRRCAYTDPGTWVKLRDFTFLPDFNVFSLRARSTYTYSLDSCLPQLKLVAANGTTYSVDCPIGNNVTCSYFAYNQVYTGPYMPNGTYAMYARSAQDISTTQSEISYYNMLGIIRQIRNPPLAQFVGGGRCRNAATGVVEDCAFSTSFGQPARTNCPVEDVNALNAPTFSLAKNIRPVSSITDLEGVRLRQLRIDVNYSGDGGAVCRGGMIGFDNPVSTSTNYRTFYTFPSKGTLAKGGYSINNAMPSWTTNFVTTDPLPDGNYVVDGWAENSTAYSIKWFIQRLDHAKIAAKSFLDAVNWKTQDAIGLIDYGDNVVTTVPLTSDVLTVENGIDSLSPSGETNTGDALGSAINALVNAPQTERFIVLLSDGRSNVGPSAVQKGIEAYNAGITVYTIGFGRDVDENELILIAQPTEEAQGQYFYAADADHLVEIFKKIAEKVQTATLSANVVIKPVPGVGYSNASCKTDTGATCTSSSTPGCECDRIITPTDGSLIYQHARIFKQSPTWWEGKLTFTVSCTEYCQSRDLYLPPASTDTSGLDTQPSFVETTAGDKMGYWPPGLPSSTPPGAQSKVNILIQDLGVHFLGGTINTATNLADVNVQVSNDGDYPIPLDGMSTPNSSFISCATGEPLNGCAPGVVVRLYKDAIDPANELCGFCASDFLCAQWQIDEKGECPSASLTSPGRSRTYLIPNLPQGFLYAKVFPEDTAPPLLECDLHNTDEAACFATSRPIFYVIDYWSWRE